MAEKLTERIETTTVDTSDIIHVVKDPSGTPISNKVTKANFIKNLSQLTYNPAVSTPSYLEGLTFYDQTKKALSYYNDEEDVTINIGQEIVFRVVNKTGSIVPNGTVVYPSSIDVPTGLPTFGLADSSEKEKCRLYGLATHEIGIDEVGYITRLGEVGGLNTTGLSGVLYISNTNPGEYTMTPPDDGGYVSIIGAVGSVHATEGTIVVDPQPSNLSVEVTDTNGFTPDQRSNTALAFDDVSRTFTISASSYPFHFYDEGDKYEKSTEETVVITDVEGLHVIYYSNGTLASLENPTESEVDVLIRTQCLVSYIYWDATNEVGSYFADERHGISMAPDTHSYLHFSRGAQYLRGLGLDNFVVDDATVGADSAQFSVDSGLITDEDLITSSNTISSTTGLPIYYIEGSGANLRRTTQTNFSIKAGVTTGNPLWNEFTGGVWQTTEVGNNDYVLYHIFAINGYDGEDKIISIMGQNEYSTVGQARNGAESEIANIILVFSFEEIVPIGTVIFQANTSYANDVNARIRSDGEGNDYVDWRFSEITPAGSVPSSHNSLAGLQGGTINEFYHLTSTQEDELTGGSNTTLHSHNLKHSTQTLTFDATQDWDVSNGTMASLTLTANCTFDAPSNLETGGEYVLILNTSTFDVTSWNSVFSWVDGNAPILPASSKVVIHFMYDGTDLMGVMNGGFA